MEFASIDVVVYPYTYDVLLFQAVSVFLYSTSLPNNKRIYKRDGLKRTERVSSGTYYKNHTEVLFVSAWVDLCNCGSEKEFELDSSIQHCFEVSEFQIKANRFFFFGFLKEEFFDNYEKGLSEVIIQCVIVMQKYCNSVVLPTDTV